MASASARVRLPSARGPVAGSVPPGVAAATTCPGRWPPVVSPKTSRALPLTADRTPAVIGVAQEVPPKSRLDVGSIPSTDAARHFEPKDDTSTGMECHQCAWPLIGEVAPTVRSHDGPP